MCLWVRMWLLPPIWGLCEMQLLFISVFMSSEKGSSVDGRPQHNFWWALSKCLADYIRWWAKFFSRKTTTQVFILILINVSHSCRLKSKSLALPQDVVSLRTSKRFSYFKFFNFVEYWMHFSWVSGTEFQRVDPSHTDSGGARWFAPKLYHLFVCRLPRIKTGLIECEKMCVDVWHTLACFVSWLCAYV